MPDVPDREGERTPPAARGAAASAGVGDAVQITDALTRRQGRVPDHAAEAHALDALARTLATDPRGLLQQVVETAMALCGADSAGVSVLEPGGEHGVFRWQAAAGAFAPHLHGTMPREASPCGDVLRRNEVLLLDRPARAFAALRGFEPAIHESLLAPWEIDGAPAGTLWVLAHAPERRFDGEDARLLASLARFAAAAWQTVTALEAAELGRAATTVELRQSEARYHVLFERMEQGFCIIERVATAGAPSDYRYVAANPAFARHTGMRDVVGRTIRELVPDAEQRIMDVYDDVVRTGRHVRFEDYVAPLDLWIEAEVFPAQRPGSIVVLFSNVSDRKRAELALRASEARYRALGTASADVLYRMSPDWTEMRQLDGRGFLSDTPAPSGTWLGRYIHADDQARVTAAIDEAVCTRRTFALEHRVIRADGTLGWTFSRAVPVFDAAGETVEWIGSASDVTARKEGELALRASEARYRALFDSIDEGFCVVQMLFDGERAVDYRFLEANPAFVQQTGLTDAVGRRMRELAPAHEAHWFEIYGRVALTGEPIRFEAPAEALGHWYDVYAFRVGEPHERRVAILFTDVATRKRAEAALRASEARHRLIVEGARDYAILATDPEGRITSWSPGAEAVFGWPAAEAVGRSVDETFVPEDRVAGVPAAERATAVAHETAPDVRWHQRADGARVFIEGATRALRDESGTLQGFVKVGQDVTERRRLDEALRASQVRYRELVENVRDYAIFLLDARGFVTEWPAGAQQVKGYTAAEAVGQPLALFYTPEDVAAGVPERHLAEAAATGRGEWEGWRVRKGGARFWANEIATAVHDAEGRLVGFTKISRDLTERRAVETVTEQTQVVAARDELRRALAAAEEGERQRLARELHDQLGQELTAFRLGLDDAARMAAEHVLPDAPLLGRLAQLGALADRMTAGARYLALELRPPELDDVGFESALASYVAEWGGRYGVATGFEVIGRARERPLPTDVGSTLYRIAQEALTNVAKHAAASQVSVIVEKPNGELRLIVEDDGRGFDVAATDALAHVARRLGIAGMRERAALVGGTIAVESSPGVGTTVYVWVPLAHPPVAAEGA